MAVSARPLPPLLFLLLSLAGSACGPPEDAERFQVEPSAERLGYFLESYEASRAHFRHLISDLAETRPELAGGIIAVPSAYDKDLSIDWAYLPSEGKDDALLILTCGTHGVEAFATCAVLRHFMAEVAPEVEKEKVGLLLIHSLNPWGFKHSRRVTEQNVDLNRNFALDESLYDQENKGYQALDPLLNPREPVRVGSLGHRLFTVRAMAKILRHGMATLRQAALQGQYEFAEGMYFGGEALEPQADLIAPLFREKAESYETVVMIDLHTGYGERGTLHLFPITPEDEGVRAATEAFFSGYRIDWGDEEDFYQATGGFSTWVGSLLPPETVFVPDRSPPHLPNRCGSH
ncbi:MAG: M14 family metallopeptidase [Longimicrobiales bacterium]